MSAEKRIAISLNLSLFLSHAFVNIFPLIWLELKHAVINVAPRVEEHAIRDKSNLKFGNV